MAKKLVVEFERVHSGQAAYQRKARLWEYQKKMPYVRRRGRRGTT